MNSSLYMSIIESVPNPVLVASPEYCGGKVTDFTIEYVNPAFKGCTQYDIKPGMKYYDFSDALVLNPGWFSCAVQAAVNKKPYVTVCYDSPAKKWFSLEMTGTPDHLCVVTLTDVSEIKIQERKLDYMSYYDSLTGLPNRNFFKKIIGSLIKRAEKNGRHMGLMLIDIDNMKMLNDTAGHDAGDKTLIRCADLLRNIHGHLCRVFRLGDDEFIIAVLDVVLKADMEKLSEEIFESFKNAKIHISAGVAASPADGSSPNVLLEYADLAMHNAKQDGKKRVESFHDCMYRKLMDHNMLQNRLISAAEYGKFDLYFQPQYMIKTKELRGFEALLRWHDDAFGWVSPDIFIPVAEETNRMAQLGYWVMETAIKTLKRWKAVYNFEGIMSINVSSSQLKRPDFVCNLYNLLHQYKVEPEKFEIEIMESVLCGDTEKTLDTLHQIRNGGVNIALDDFGTGFSSYKYLRCLPLSTLKIDKEFINNLNSENCVEAEITDSIVSLVSKMGVTTIAEGVETDRQLDILKGFNCNIVQGFLSGKPMESRKCDLILNSRRQQLDAAVC